MNSELSCHIRWRWFLGGVGLLTATLLTLWGVHEAQMPRIANRMLAQARSLTSAGDLDDARRCYSDYLQLKSGNTVACEEYAHLVLASSEKLGEARADSTALRLLDVAVQSGKASEATKRLFVKTAMRLENYSVAHQMLRSMDPEQLSNAEMWSALGTCELQLRNASAAETAFRKALDIDQTHIEAWTGLLELYADVMDEMPKAIATADAMRKVTPVEAQAARAWLHLRLDELPAARDCFLEAARASQRAKYMSTILLNSSCARIWMSKEKIDKSLSLHINS